MHHIFDRAKVKIEPSVGKSIWRPEWHRDSLGLRLSLSNGLRILNEDFTRFLQSPFQPRSHGLHLPTIFPELTLEGENLSKDITHCTCGTASTARANVEDTEKKYMQRLVTLQVIWEILFTIKRFLEKQIVRFSLPRRRFPAVPFRGVSYCRIYSVDLAKGVLKPHGI